ncbi:hypothetical protein [Flaviaesturariibacter terrae]
MKKFFSLAAGIAMAFILLLAATWLHYPARGVLLPGFDFPAERLQDLIRCSPFV